MKLKLFLFTALLALAGSAFAAPPPTSTDAGPMGHHQGPCEKDPSKCQADAAKFDTWCQANAEKCTNLKAWAEKRIERCEANKQKCEEMREKMHERHEERHSMKQNGQPSDQDQPGDQDEPDDQPPPPPAD